MTLKTKHYNEQIKEWPKHGKHILAQFNDDSVVVYQAYRKSIAQFAVENQFFGGDFSYNRMSWIKPNFLWMMYRSGWGTKAGQEHILAIHLKPEYFFEILSKAFPSSNILGLDNDKWKEQVAQTNVRLQWDPDHDPYGEKQERKAIQLGLRNDFLLPFKGEGIVKIEDISDFVAEQRVHVENNELHKLITPAETVMDLSEEIQKTLFMKREKSNEN